MSSKRKKEEHQRPAQRDAEHVRRILLHLAYDGTNYNGYQSQTNAVGIQDILEKSIRDLFGGDVRTIGASRTDTGVHARDNLVVFDCDAKMLPGKIALALNARLPDDIRVMESMEVPGNFHPRHCDSVKTYSYRIMNRRVPDPLWQRYALHYYYPLDESKMAAAASYLVGTHDFASFCSSGFSGKSTVRTIYRSEVTREGDLITYTVSGSGFLYNMVRIITGTLILAGSGQMAPEEMMRILEARDRSAAGDTAPPKGLTLEKIEIPELGIF